MRPKWMEDAEGESSYGSVGGTLLKALLMGVGVAAGIDFLIAKKKKIKLTLLYKMKEILKNYKSSKRLVKKGLFLQKG